VLESRVFEDVVHEGDHGEAVGEEDVPWYAELSGEGQRRGAKGVTHECHGGAAHYEVAEVEDRAAGELKHDGTKVDVRRERLSFLS
jgi:hypothetical protein